MSEAAPPRVSLPAKVVGFGLVAVGALSIPLIVVLAIAVAALAGEADDTAGAILKGAMFAGLFLPIGIIAIFAGREVLLKGVGVQASAERP